MSVVIFVFGFCYDSIKCFFLFLLPLSNSPSLFISQNRYVCFGCCLLFFFCLPYSLVFIVLNMHSSFQHELLKIYRDVDEDENGWWSNDVIYTYFHLLVCFSGQITYISTHIHKYNIYFRHYFWDFVMHTHTRTCTDARTHIHEAIQAQKQ